MCKKDIKIIKLEINFYITYILNILYITFNNIHIEQLLLTFRQ